MRGFGVLVSWAGFRLPWAVTRKVGGGKEKGATKFSAQGPLFFLVGGDAWGCIGLMSRVSGLRKVSRIAGDF